MQFIYFLLLSMTSNEYKDPKIKPLQNKCFTLKIKFIDEREKEYDALDTLTSFEIFSEECEFLIAENLKENFFYLEYKLNTTLDIFEDLIENISVEQLKNSDYLKAYNYLRPIRLHLPQEFKKISDSKSEILIERKVVFSIKGIYYLLKYFLKKLNIKSIRNDLYKFIVIGEYESSLLPKTNENQRPLYVKLRYLKQILTYKYIPDISDDIYLRLFNFIKEENSNFCLKRFFVDSLSTFRIRNIFICLESTKDNIFISLEIFKDFINLLKEKQITINVNKNTNQRNNFIQI